MLHELGQIFLLSIHHEITKTLQVALFLSTGAENHRSNGLPFLLCPLHRRSTVYLSNKGNPRSILGVQRALTRETFDDVVVALVVVPVNASHSGVSDGKLHDVAFDEISRYAEGKTEGGRLADRIARQMT